MPTRKRSWKSREPRQIRGLREERVASSTMIAPVEWQMRDSLNDLSSKNGRRCASGLPVLHRQVEHFRLETFCGWLFRFHLPVPPP